MDIEDLVIRAIQSYGNVLIMAIADQLAPHIIKELGLKQEWGVAVDHSLGILDEVAYDSSDREWSQEMLERLEVRDQDLSFGDCNARRYLATRLYTGWTEDEKPPLDPELVQLAAEVDDL